MWKSCPQYSSQFPIIFARLRKSAGINEAPEMGSILSILKLHRKKSTVQCYELVSLTSLSRKKKTKQQTTGK